MLSRPQGGQGDEGVRMLTRAHHHGIERHFAVEKFSKINLPTRLGILPLRRIQTRFKHVTDGDDILCLGHFRQIGTTPSPHADGRHAQTRV
jgi:hypothetical protein